MMDFMPAGKFGEEVRGVRVKRGVAACAGGIRYGMRFSCTVRRRYLPQAEMG